MFAPESSSSTAIWCKAVLTWLRLKNGGPFARGLASVQDPPAMTLPMRVGSRTRAFWHNHGRDRNHRDSRPIHVFHLTDGVYFHSDIFQKWEDGIDGTELHHVLAIDYCRHTVVVIFIRWRIMGFKLSSKATFCTLCSCSDSCSLEYQGSKRILRSQSA